MSSKDQVLAAALALAPSERLELIDDLWQATGDDELSPEQQAELRRRVAALDRGETKFVDGETALRQIIESLGRR